MQILKKVRLHQLHCSLPLCFLLVSWGICSGNLTYCTSLKSEDCFVSCSRLTTLSFSAVKNANNWKYFKPVLKLYMLVQKRFFPKSTLRLPWNSFAVYQKATVISAG